MQKKKTSKKKKLDISFGFIVIVPIYRDILRHLGWGHKSAIFFKNLKETVFRSSHDELFQSCWSKSEARIEKSFTNIYKHTNIMPNRGNNVKYYWGVCPITTNNISLSRQYPLSKLIATPANQNVLKTHLLNLYLGGIYLYSEE